MDPCSTLRGAQFCHYYFPPKLHPVQGRNRDPCKWYLSHSHTSERAQYLTRARVLSLILLMATGDWPIRRVYGAGTATSLMTCTSPSSPSLPSMPSTGSYASILPSRQLKPREAPWISNATTTAAPTEAALPLSLLTPSPLTTPLRQSNTGGASIEPPEMLPSDVPPNDNALPLHLVIDPALGCAGALLILTGMLLAFVGQRSRWFVCLCSG